MERRLVPSPFFFPFFPFITYCCGCLFLTSPEVTKWITSFVLMMFFAYTVWCRRTDELVDGPNASHITPQALDRWESRLEDLFQGRPFDMLDAALSDTVTQFPVDIQVRVTVEVLYVRSQTRRNLFSRHLKTFSLVHDVLLKIYFLYR